MQNCFSYTLTKEASFCVNKVRIDKNVAWD